MVEHRSRPAAGVVTRGALRCAVATPELALMNVLVTARALARSSLEWDLPRELVRTQWLVAVQATEDLVSASKRVARKGVIEGFQLLPGRRAVAGFADILGGPAAGSHHFRKLSTMRIRVAAYARQLIETELPVVRMTVLLVAILARHGGVGTLQRKVRRLMIPNAESGRPKAVHRVATLAPVRPRGAGELSCMNVAMAVQAGLEPRVIVGIESRWPVALRAGQSLVFARERVRGGPMTGLGERRRAPTRYRMARAAVAAVGAVEELALVLVLVTILAFIVRYGGLEIRIPMTLQANHLGVLALERVFRFAVVEAVRSLHSLPDIDVVAVFAPRGKGAVVGILVAPGAGGERQAGVLDHFGVGRRRAMTFGAIHFLMFAGEGIVRGGVIVRLQLPGGDGVALLAVRAQLPGMAVLMARQTCLMKPFEGLVQVANPDQPAVGR